MSQIIPWAQMNFEQRKATLEDSIRRQRKLPGIACLYDAEVPVLEAFAADHLPHLMNAMSLCRLSREAMVRKKCADDDYPPFNRKGGRLRRERE